MRYGDKASARKAVWDTLQAKRVARFPFPPQLVPIRRGEVRAPLEAYVTA